MTTSRRRSFVPFVTLVLAVAAACGTVPTENPVDATPLADAIELDGDVVIDAPAIDAPDLDAPDVPIDAAPIDAAPIDATIDAPPPIDAPATARLTVVRSGAGPGTITSSPAGISCGATCNFDFPTGTLVTLTAAPGTGGSFTGWGGACSGSITTCSLVVNADTVVNADFALATHTVTVVTGGNGTGTVTSSAGGINCPGTCTATVPYGTSITLSTSTSAPSMFVGWSGGTCTGTGTCTFNVTSNVTINASFALNFTLVVSRAGNGNGSVTSSPAGITCGADCDQTYGAGTVVTLTAVAAADSTFTGWTGSGCTGTGTCTVTVNGATAVAAGFTLRQYTLTATKTGSGAGTVTSSPAGINCGADCSEVYNHGQMVTLTATPTGSGNTFGGWSGGGCSGTATTCTVTVTAAATVTADFDITQRTLTVVRAGDGSGTVTSSPAGISCGADCTETYNHGTVVTLTATAATTPLSVHSTFTGWTGGCSGTATSCTVALTAATTVTATFSLRPNIAFVTSVAQDGDRGGLTGADFLCQLRAQQSGLAGTYRAWLSTAATSAVSRLSGASGWVRVDGRPLVNTPADLVAGRMFHPLRIDELGADVGEVQVHTGTNPSGVLHSNSTDCDAYTTALATDDLTGGRSDGVSSVFTSFTTTDCARTARFYCFGVDRAATVAPTPAPSFRRAFTTTVGWTPGGGLASADALCQSEATAASLPGTYRALLATASASAASRFSTSGAPWGRPDGVLITPTAATMFTAAYWTTAPNTNAANTASYGNNGIWGGATSFTAVGTNALSCASWIASASTFTANGGRSGFTSTADAIAYVSDNDTACNVTHVRLRCLQQ